VLMWWWGRSGVYWSVEGVAVRGRVEGTTQRSLVVVRKS
jgi:hypothetical protein